MFVLIAILCSGSSYTLHAKGVGEPTRTSYSLTKRFCSVSLMTLNFEHLVMKFVTIITYLEQTKLITNTTGHNDYRRANLHWYSSPNSRTNGKPLNYLDSSKGPLIA